jgi:hypothetical protein
MAKIANVSINLDKITKSKLIKGKKGTYLNFNIAVNDEKDQFGNDCSLWENQSKEERDSKTDRNFFGNGKVIWSNEGNVSVSPGAEDIDDGLPF